MHCWSVGHSLFHYIQSPLDCVKQVGAFTLDFDRDEIAFERRRLRDFAFAQEDFPHFRRHPTLPHTVPDARIVLHVSKVNSDDTLAKWLAIQRMPRVLAIHERLPKAYRKRLRSDVVAAQKLYVDTEPPFEQEGASTNDTANFAHRATTAMGIIAKASPKVLFFRFQHK